jgi:hypothetical protein
MKTTSFNFLQCKFWSNESKKKKIPVLNETSSGGKNPFVEACVQFSLEYVFAKCDTKKLGCNIVIVGDNDFYSQRAQVSFLSLLARPF